MFAEKRLGERLVIRLESIRKTMSPAKERIVASATSVMLLLPMESSVRLGSSSPSQSSQLGWHRLASRELNRDKYRSSVKVLQKPRGKQLSGLYDRVLQKERESEIARERKKENEKEKKERR